MLLDPVAKWITTLSERAVLLVGGDKRGQWNRWYPGAIRQTEERYEQHRRETTEG